MGRPKRKQSPEEASFMHQKRGLFKKIHELQTLCNVTACMVICPPPSLAASAPEIWPEDPSKLGRIARMYKDRQNQTARVVASGDGPERRAPAAAAGSRVDGWVRALGRLDSSQLLRLSAVVESKIGEAGRRMRWLEDVHNDLHCDDNRDVYQTSTEAFAPANHREFLPQNTLVGGGGGGN